jgi:APA family basic amino acid/polyamine antiporter
VEAATAPRGAAATQDGLKRAISRNMLLLFVVGDVLGAGIYALVGTIGDRVGGAIWASFLLAIVLAFLIVVAAINARGIGESVKLNVGFTLIELSGLVLVVVIGAGALFDGLGDPGRALEIKDGEALLPAVMAGAGPA